METATLRDTGAVTQEEAATPQVPMFHIDSEERANWYLRKMFNLQAELDRVNAQAAAIVHELEQKQRSLQMRFEDELAAWAEGKLTGQKARHIKLLQGTVGFRKVAARLDVTDQAAALAWLNEHPDEQAKVIEQVTTERFCKTAYLGLAKVSAEETGELLPGVEMQPEQQRIYIKESDDAQD